jgi:nucleotide-binding universal stress UspA family protein
VAQWQRNAEEYLAEVAQRLNEVGIKSRLLTELGGPVDTILNTASTADADCIVMATHARVGFDRLLHGSVASAVLNRCGCPLLLVHAAEAPVHETADPESAVAR